MVVPGMVNGPWQVWPVGQLMTWSVTGNTGAGPFITKFVPTGMVGGGTLQTEIVVARLSTSGAGFANAEAMRATTTEAFATENIVMN